MTHRTGTICRRIYRWRKTLSGSKNLEQGGNGRMVGGPEERQLSEQLPRQVLQKLIVTFVCAVLLGGGAWAYRFFMNSPTDWLGLINLVFLVAALILLHTSPVSSSVGRRAS